MNPLPDCSNYSPFCHTHYLILRIPFTRLCHKSSRVIFPCCCYVFIMSKRSWKPSLKSRNWWDSCGASNNLYLSWNGVYCTLRPRSRNFVKQIAKDFPTFIYQLKKKTCGWPQNFVKINIMIHCSLQHLFFSYLVILNFQGHISLGVGGPTAPPPPPPPLFRIITFLYYQAFNHKALNSQFVFIDSSI